MPLTRSFRETVQARARREKLELLRIDIKAGLDALERGAFTEVDDADLDAMLDGLAAPT